MGDRLADAPCATHHNRNLALQFHCYTSWQAAEKASQASLRSTDFASTYRDSTPPLIDHRAPRL
jgi:hypothetical protein